MEDKKKLPPSSLERFFPTPDEELGIGGSDISDSARKRHYGRYARISTMVEKYVRAKDLVLDVGSGSGYGTKMLADRFRKVIGIEPNDEAREYAKKHYPSVGFAADSVGGDVVVMVESVEHMSPGEAKSYVYRAHTWALTTPILEHAWNEYHEQNWKTISDLNSYIAKFGFKPVDMVIDLGITFTTNETGNNVLAVYRRA